MLDEKGELAFPPVCWVQQDADETEALAEELSQSDESIGANWHLAYGLADSQLISHLYQRLNHCPHADDQRQLAVISVAAFHVLQQNPELYSPGVVEANIQRALSYLTTPSPWLGRENGLHVALAHSAHFVLDPEGFANIQRALSVDHRTLIEVTDVSA